MALQVNFASPRLGDVGPTGSHEPLFFVRVAEKKYPNLSGFLDPEICLKSAHLEVALLSDLPSLAR